MKVHYFKTPISEEEIDNIISQALMGAANIGWADEARIKSSSNKDDVDYVSEEVSRGGVIEIHDAEENKWHELDLKKLLKGLELVKNHNFEEYDMYKADLVVQMAIFGKAVYA